MTPRPNKEPEEMKNAAKPWIMDLRMYEPGKPIEETARELGFENTDEIIKAASNENALGPSPMAVEAVIKAAKNMHLYPDGGAFHLRHKLARRLGVKPWQLMIANGSNEIIEFIGHVFLDPDVEMIMSEHAFAIFKLIGLMFQARVVETPMKNYTHDLPAMLRAITPKTRVVFIANPNNPTGTMVSNREIAAFMKDVPDHVVVCMDEAYIDLLPENQQPDTLRYVHENRHIIILRSFSKSCGIAGLRVGYAVAPEAGIELMQRVRQPFNVNSIALAAAAAALDDREHMERTRAMVAEGLKFYERELTRLKIGFIPARVNFLLIDVGNGREVFQALEREKVITRPMDGYGLPRHIRMTIGTREQNERCLQALCRVLAARGAPK